MFAGLDLDAEDPATSFILAGGTYMPTGIVAALRGDGVTNRVQAGLEARRVLESHF